VTAFTLVVERGRLSAAEFPLQRPSTTIGSAPMNDVCVADAGIARIQVEIRVDESGLAALPVAAGGTSVNGMVIRGRTALQHGDRLTIGQACVFRIRRAVDGGPEPTPGGGSGASSGSRPFALPRWVVAYLAAMLVVFGLVAFKRPSGSRTFTAIRTDEISYATRHGLDGEQTDRMISLITLAQIEERRGNLASAYELYRDALAARAPADPKSPAYLFATRRMVAVRR
jgi:hypothetical protein